MRPKIRDGERLREGVRKYAKDNGIRMPEAWRQIVSDGLETNDIDT